MAKWKEPDTQKHLATARAEGYAQGVRDAAHLMPRYFGVWSATGVHIGVWDDSFTAANVLAEYPGGVMRDFIDMDAILALLDSPAPAQPSPEAVARAALEWAAGKIYPWSIAAAEEIEAAATNTTTRAQIIAQAGKDHPHD